MDVTVAQVLAGARQYLGDTEVEAGEVYTDAKLTPFYQTAYGEIISKLVSIGASDIILTGHYNLPARTSYLTPAQIGISDMDEPVHMWERGALTKAAVTAASAASPIVITAAGHPFADLAEVIISQVGPEANGRWFINKINGDSFSLRGSSSAVVYSGITGSATSSTEKFTIMSPVDNLSQTDPRDRLYEYEYEGGVFRFVGATAERQLMIEYKSNGTPPSSGNIGINNSGNFLKARTAALAALTNNATSLASDLNDLCFGVPAKQISGFLDDVIRPAVLSMQGQVWRSQSFRRRRTRNYF